MTEGKVDSYSGHFSFPLRDLGMRLKGSWSLTQASSVNGTGMRLFMNGMVMRGYGSTGRLANETINRGCL